MNQEELQSLAEPRTSYEQRLREMANALLTRYGNPPPQIDATVIDTNGNTYKGVLYLVEEKASEE